MGKNKVLPSISYHFWQPCNMRCEYCYGKFQDVKQSILPKGHLKESDSKRLIYEFWNFGFRKITFAGGEPTLCPWLANLVKYAKYIGFTTSLVTNGYKLSKDYIDKFEDSLDWITLSIDSLDEVKLSKIGRAVNGKIISKNEYLEKCILVKQNKIRLKINTVVSRLNWNESFSRFILKAKPERWKLLQVLKIEGQNTPEVDKYELTTSEFFTFCNEHSFLREFLNINIVNESVELMKGSYVLIDPAGRFFDNLDGHYNYSDPILDIGISDAYNQIRIKEHNFIKRDGIYNWERFDNQRIIL